MSVIYLEETIKLLFSVGKKVEVDNLVKNGEVKQTELGVKYLKITEDEQLDKQ